MSRVDKTSLWRLYSSIVQYTTVSGVSRLQSEYRVATFRFWRHRKIVVLSFFIIREPGYLCIHFDDSPPVFGTAYWRVSLNICHLKNDLYPRIGIGRTPTHGPVKQDKDSLQGRKKILHLDEPNSTTVIPRRNQPSRFVLNVLIVNRPQSSPIVPNRPQSSLISGYIHIRRITEWFPFLKIPAVNGNITNWVQGLGNI